MQPLSTSPPKVQKNMSASWPLPAPRPGGDILVAGEEERLGVHGKERGWLPSGSFVLTCAQTSGAQAISQCRSGT